MSDFKKSTLCVADCGDGPAVVLVPGLGGLGRFWRPTQLQLIGSFRTLAIDHPGMGGSPAEGAQSIDAIARQVVALLDQLGLERAHIVGHSTGGLVAQALALDAPDRVHRLVLSSTWAKADQRFHALFRLRQEVLRSCGAAAYAALGELLAYPSQWYERHLAAPAEAGGAAQTSSMNVALTLERIDMLLAYERSEELARIPVPVLVVGAPDDNIVPFHHSQDLAARIPHARLAQIAGGHFTPTTEVSAYAELITSFLGADN